MKIKKKPQHRQSLDEFTDELLNEALDMDDRLEELEVDYIKTCPTGKRLLVNFKADGQKLGILAYRRDICDAKLLGKLLINTLERFYAKR